jgi:hypothetical protein
MPHRESSHPDRPASHYEPRALVGWQHRTITSGVEIELQSARSRVGLENGQIESRHYLLTANQALLLARYLLRVTGQELVREVPRGWLRRLFGRGKPI